jgi:arsenate reductase
MNTVYYLKSCDTCQKILKSLPENHDLNLHDIKQEPLTESQVDALKSLAGSYEALFSRKAQLYKSLGLKDQKLTEDDYRRYLLEHYTFLSRPVFVIDEKIFIGNQAATVQKAIEALN